MTMSVCGPPWDARAASEVPAISASRTLSLRSPRRELWQVMQSAPLPTSVAVKPALSGGVSSLIRTVAFVLTPVVVPIACGSWQVAQVCGWASSSVQVTATFVPGSLSTSIHARKPFPVWQREQVPL